MTAGANSRAQALRLGLRPFRGGRQPQYDHALTDPELVALRDELALVTAREADLLNRVDSGEAGAHWLGRRQALSDFRRAQQRQDTPGAAAALRDMERLVDLGRSDDQAWSELLRAIETRRRLADRPRRLSPELRSPIPLPRR